MAGTVRSDIVIRHIVLVVLLTGLVVLTAAPPATGQQDGVAVDGAVQVTSNPASSRGHVAPDVAIHPDDRQTIAVADGDAYSGDCSVHVSTNAGLSWTAATQPDVPGDWPNCTFVPFGPVADVEFSPEGTLYFAFNGYNGSEQQGRVFLARSDDLGQSWQTTMVPGTERNLEEGETGIDQIPSIAIDPNDADSVYVGWGSNWATYTFPEEALNGQLYYWDVIERVYVSASDDGGETFGQPVNVGEGLRLTEDKQGVKPPPQVLVGNDGEVFAFFGEYSRAGTRDDREGEAPPAHVYLAISRDGGQSYTNKAIFEHEEPTESSAWTWVPRADIDRNNGNLYVAWENMSHAGEPVQISVMRSTDGGESWDAPTQVNDAEPDRQWNYPEAYPELRVAPNGRVDVAWYDWRNDPTYDPEAEEPSNTLQDVYYTYSTDGGGTWAPDVRITDRFIDRSIGPWPNGGVRGTLGLASTDGGAYLAWSDTRNGDDFNHSQDIYFGRVRFGPSEEFFTAAGGGTPMAWGMTGAAGALALTGLVLLGITRFARRKRPDPNGD